MRIWGTFTGTLEPVIPKKHIRGQLTGQFSFAQSSQCNALQGASDLTLVYRAAAGLVQVGTRFWKLQPLGEGWGSANRLTTATSLREVVGLKEPSRRLPLGVGLHHPSSLITHLRAQPSFFREGAQCWWPSRTHAGAPWRRLPRREEDTRTLDVRAGKGNWGGGAVALGQASPPAERDSWRVRLLLPVSARPSRTQTNMHLCAGINLLEVQEIRNARR